uniref:Uncharacterized protein n=1 Tax=Triticum urartu TaxID=4572 RepID=A0A8R7VBU1_TRIUA
MITLLPSSMLVAMVERNLAQSSSSTSATSSTTVSIFPDMIPPWSAILQKESPFRCRIEEKCELTLSSLHIWATRVLFPTTGPPMTGRTAGASPGEPCCNTKFRGFCFSA